MLETASEGRTILTHTSRGPSRLTCLTEHSFAQIAPAPPCISGFILTFASTRTSKPMRTIVIVFGLVCLMGAILAQNVGIGTSTPAPSARLDVSDTLRGILIPRLTTAQRNNIPSPAHSLLIYNIDCDEYQYYIPGAGWVSLLSNVTAGGGGGGTFTAHPATNISASGFTAHWSPVTGATSYKVLVYQDCGSSTPLATATFPAGSTSGPVSVSMPCNTSRCYEVRATVSSTGCGGTVSFLISNRVPVTRGTNPCTTPNTWVSLPAPPATMA